MVRSPWPGMTRGFWGEPERYLETYWSRFPGVWVHGDWASIDEDGFWYLHGRSDDTTTISPESGVGPAEIESAAVALPEVTMAAAVGIPDEVKGEVVALYLVPAPGVQPDTDLTALVESAVAASLGNAFRPKASDGVNDLPQLGRRDHASCDQGSRSRGRSRANISGLENPESLKEL